MPLFPHKTAFKNFAIFVLLSFAITSIGFCSSASVRLKRFSTLYGLPRSRDTRADEVPPAANSRAVQVSQSYKSDVLQEIDSLIELFQCELAQSLIEVRDLCPDDIESFNDCAELFGPMNELMHLDNNYHKKLLVNQYGFLKTYKKIKSENPDIRFSALDTLCYFVLNTDKKQTVYRKAFDIIDYTYMSGAIDKLTDCPGRAYRLRQNFLNLALCESAERNLESYRDKIENGTITPREGYAPDESTSSGLDEFMGKVNAKGAYKVIKWFFKVFDKSKAEAVQLSYELMSPRPNYYLELQRKENMNKVVFVDEYLRCLNDEAFRQGLQELQVHVDALTTRLSQSNSPGDVPLDTVYDTAKSILGTREKAIKMLGVLCSQRLSLFYGMKDFLKKQGVYHRYVRALKSAALIHFQLFNVNFHCKRLSGGKKYSYTYPKGYECDNMAYYHFWSAAFIGLELNENNVSQEDNLWAAKNIALAYEVATFPIASMMQLFAGANFFSTIGNGVACSKKDVALHVNGAKFATESP